MFVTQSQDITNDDFGNLVHAYFMPWIQLKATLYPGTRTTLATLVWSKNMLLVCVKIITIQSVFCLEKKTRNKS